ncbi:type II secretion system protein [Shewanella waksmanii]|uniref:type II secretion system protein n=1 Tax=Shewanella waksmanii TaxID=213783 RepID=UPI0037351275
MKSNRGFTLIELVVVIIILGVLAVVAAPKFLNLSKDAHESVAKAAFGAFSSGVSLYHQCWQVEGTNTTVYDLDCYGDGSIDSTVTGFPLGQNTQSNGNNGTQLNGEYCRELWQGLLDNNELVLDYHHDGAFGGDTDIVYWYAGGPVSSPNTYCYFNYIADDQRKGQENWQLRYYPGDGRTVVTRSTLG